MAKALEQRVNERIQQQIGALVIDNARLIVEVEVAREEIETLKAAAATIAAKG